MNKRLRLSITALVGLTMLLTACSNDTRTEATNQKLQAKLEQVKVLENIKYTDEYKQMVKDVSWVYVQMLQDYPDYKDIDIKQYQGKIVNQLYDMLVSEIENTTGVNYHIHDSKENTEVYTNGENTEEVDLSYLVDEEYLDILNDEQEKNKEEATFDLEYFNSLSEEEQNDYINNMTEEEVQAYLKAMGGDNYNDYLASMTEEERAEFLKEEEQQTIEKDITEKSFNEVMAMAEEQERKARLHLVYEAYYEDRAVIRYKNENGFNATLHLNGNPNTGIQSIDVIYR